MKVKQVMKILDCSLAASMVLIGVSLGIAQNMPAPSSTQFAQPIVADCEGNVATLSVTHQTAASLGANSLIIAIARLGDGERLQELNRRRLHNVQIYLKDFWKRPLETVITAEGEHVKGYGRVELYVGGRLFDVMAVRRNQDLMVGSCEPDDIRPKRADRNLYPYLDKKRRR